MTSAEDRGRFIREGRLAASINHPNSVYVYGTEVIDGFPAIAMEIASGGTLRDRVDQSGPMPPEQAVDATLQAIAGLKAAQAAGVHHRDVKPSNLFVDTLGTIKVGDYGLSISNVSNLSMETQLTATGTIIGTPAFAPPEQLRGEDLDVRADIYSVGASLYFLLTREFPFDARDPVKLIAAVLQETPVSPRTIEPQIAPGLAAVVLKCLEKTAAARYSNYDELRRALAPFSSAARTPASLTMRAIAYFIDRVFFFAVMGAGTAVFLRQSPVEWIQPSGYSILLIQATLMEALYFGICEGFFGAGAGKALLGLRVIGLDGGRPGFARALARSGIFALVNFLRGLVQLLILSYVGVVSALVTGVLFQAAPVVLFFRARRGNGFAGLHDGWSDTRVVLKRAPEAAVTLPGNPLLTEFKESGKIGPYSIIEKIAEAAGESTFLALDRQLSRRVWIHCPQGGAPPVPAMRRDLSRPGRLRWLGGRRSPNETWDAYGFIEGKPLSDFLLSRQPWGSIRRWLYDVVSELAAAAADGTSVYSIAIDQIYIGADGHARILDFPLGSSSLPLNDRVHPGDMISVQTFLYSVAAMALEGSTHVPQRGNRLSPVPVPDDARRFLRHLRDARFDSLEAIRTSLKPLQEQEPAVSRSSRAGHICCMAGVYLLATVISFILVRFQAHSVSVYPDADRFYHAIKELDDPAGLEDKAALETYIAGHFRQVYLDRAGWAQTIAAMNFDRRMAARAGQVFAKAAPSEAEVRSAGMRIAKFRQGLDDSVVHLTGVLDQIVVLILLPMTTLGLVNIFAILLAFIARGPCLASLFGITLVMNDGSEVNRGRALFRSFVSAVPFLAAATVFFLQLDKNHYELDVTIILFSFVVGAAGAAFAILNPERGLQDYIAGTALVPRLKE